MTNLHFLDFEGSELYQAGSFGHFFNDESPSSNGNLPVKGDGKMGPKKCPKLFGCAQIHWTRVANASFLRVIANLHVQFSMICYIYTM